MNEIESYYPENKQQWRDWLAQNHLKKEAVWLIFYKKKSGKPTLTWSEAVDEALCFGWRIDSIRKTLDEESSIQFFSKRKAKSTWSKINKDKITQLIENQQMSPAGFESIAIAKSNGSWEILDDVEALVIPADLEMELNLQAQAMETFQNLSKTLKKMCLHRLLFAKRPETRQKRIADIMQMLHEKTIKKPLL